MSRTNTLTIQDVRKETTDTVSVAFTVPEELKETYQFTQGQYLTLIANINGESVRRSYSVCTSPSENELRVAIKQIPGGKFSTYANTRLKAGDQLEVMKPMGKFNTELNPANQKNYVLFAAGSGITPIISIIKTTLETEPNSTLTLIYGNKTLSSVIFKNQLEELQANNSQRFELVHVLSRETALEPNLEGRINAERCDQLQANVDFYNADEFFLCGPRPMVDSVTEWLQKQGVDKKKIHFELFTSKIATDKPEPATQQAVNDTGKEQATGEQPTTSKVTVVVDGDVFDFEMPDASVSLLDAAANEGADVPFSCKGGVCCTCKAKLMEGKVTMDLNYSLTDGELEQGYILACQSHPTTAKVVVNFDER